MSQGLTLGAKIKNERIRNALTQEELAQAVGVKPITISFWENGRIVPRPSHIKKLAKVLHIAVTDLTANLTIKD